MLFLRLLIVTLVAMLPMFLTACNEAQETADATEQAGDGAVGIAEKMSDGTVGDALDDEDGEY